jgi:hypothetical protein
MFYVKYTVVGFPGEQKAGPYSASEVQYQRNDIAAYEGVQNVVVVPADEEVTDKLEKAFDD